MDASNTMNSIVSQVPYEVIDSSLGLTEDNDTRAIAVILQDL